MHHNLWNQTKHHSQLSNHNFHSYLIIQLEDVDLAQTQKQSQYLLRDTFFPLSSTFRGCVALEGFSPVDLGPWKGKNGVTVVSWNMLGPYDTPAITGSIWGQLPGYRLRTCYLQNRPHLRRLPEPKSHVVQPEAEFSNLLQGVGLFYAPTLLPQCIPRLDWPDKKWFDQTNHKEDFGQCSCLYFFKYLEIRQWHFNRQGGIRKHERPSNIKDIWYKGALSIVGHRIMIWIIIWIIDDQ